MSPDPTLDSNCILLAEAEGTTLFSYALLKAVTRLPRPGIIIFVHGVNSDGEWYEQAEQGLCEGLNARLARLSRSPDYPFTWRTHETVPCTAHPRRFLHVCAIDGLRRAACAERRRSPNNHGPSSLPGTSGGPAVAQSAAAARLSDRVAAAMDVGIGQAQRK
ncbi:T6SS effector phospholipase Tle3 domain-containing protein [Janthinobacterium lividum]|uniref:T6SS effector phospholipase Tle3 domain-containing protein n=1 Tax=Janthinobacterium lividum TaxID=29581 RepID=UPI003D7C2D52